MTRQEAQKRNLSIMQFKGMYNRINKLIPDDIRDELTSYQMEILEKAAIIYNEINELWIKKQNINIYLHVRILMGKQFVFLVKK